MRFIAKKKGMTQFFDDKGKAIACSVILAEPNVVVQIKKREKDGYNALQLGAFADIKEKNIKKPVRGHFKELPPCRYLTESKVENVEEYQVGQKIDIGYFSNEKFIDIEGISKGKGYQGVMKLYGFKGGPKSHGSGFHRHAGSTGMRSTPGRCLPGGKRAGRMGGDRITVQNLEIFLIDKENNLLIVRGAIPGCCEGVVYIKKAKKKRG
ncbi:MAG: 50S ribosomal protein L3 [Chlamydiae bacterium SM23_39]|nr:MAG: 50S ribosomal protein L3 [Chlamydiae bacterium SM23_39]